MQFSVPASSSTPASPTEQRATRQILSCVSFTFIVYLSIGLPFSVLPPFIHLRMGYSAFVAGIAISTQYIATLVTRPWAGRISDHFGAKVAVMWGMASCTASGAVLVAVLAFHGLTWLAFLTLMVSRLLIGVGESLGSTGSTLWGITATGPKHTARVIGWNGISTYAGVGVGAPLGVVLYQQWGLPAIGILTMAVCGLGFLIATRKGAIPAAPGEHLPFAHVVGRVLPHGIGLALGQMVYNVLATFIALYYLSRHWPGAALCLTAFAVAFILSRLLFIRAINIFGGYRVAKVTLLIEAMGTVLLWRAVSPVMATIGAAICGLGFSLVFPAIGVEAVERVPEFNRGTALGVYTAFADVSFFIVGPVAGALIGLYGYPSVFLFALISTLAAMAIVFVLARAKRKT